MKRYKNVSHSSGVRNYDPKDTSLDVKFKDGSIYTYPKSEVGEEGFARMERAATTGKGLATMISRDSDIRFGFSKRVRGAKRG